MEINGIKVQDLPPDELAQVLAEGNLKLVSLWVSLHHHVVGSI